MVEAGDIAGVYEEGTTSKSERGMKLLSQSFVVCSFQILWALALIRN